MNLSTNCKWLWKNFNMKNKYTTWIDMNGIVLVLSVYGVHARLLRQVQPVQRGIFSEFVWKFEVVSGRISTWRIRLYHRNWQYSGIVLVQGLWSSRPFIETSSTCSKGNLHCEFVWKNASGYGRISTWRIRLYHRNWHKWYSLSLRFMD